MYLTALSIRFSFIALLIKNNLERIKLWGWWFSYIRISSKCNHFAYYRPCPKLSSALFLPCLSCVTVSLNMHYLKEMDDIDRCTGSVCLKWLSMLRNWPLIFRCTIYHRHPRNYHQNLTLTMLVQLYKLCFFISIYSDFWVKSSYKLHFIISIFIIFIHVLFVLLLFLGGPPTCILCWHALDMSKPFQKSFYNLILYWCYP